MYKLPNTCLAVDSRALADEPSSGITVISDSPGVGKHPAANGDLLLFHYVGGWLLWMTFQLYLCGR
jgi:hypothetical protein